MTTLQMCYFRFPKERDTYGIDHQFLSGRSLLISPALEEVIMNTLLKPLDHTTPARRATGELNCLLL